MNLAIADSRRPPPPPPQRSNGGCVSIFFQLFTKKKQFVSQSKLLPSGNRAASNVDKISTSNLIVIADENQGGYPKPKSETDPDLDNRMQAPGLVARLMGLESIPVVHNEKPRKALDLEFRSDCSSERSRVDDGLGVDSGDNEKIELRVQKVQKSGMFLERRPIEGFRRGLGFQGSRKKLQSPVKSPRLLTRSSTSRLVQVANKILEPGLQSKGRARFAITYRGALGGEREGGRDRLSGDFLSGSCKSSASSGVKGDSLVGECASSASDLSNGSEERKKTESPVIASGQRRNDAVVIQSKLKGEEVNKMKESVITGRLTNNRSLAIQAKLNVECRAHDLLMRKKNSANTGDQCETSAFRKNNLRKQDEKNHNDLSRAKNFVVLNKNVNNYARLRSPTKVSRVELERDGKEMNVTQKSNTINKNTEDFDNSFTKVRRSNVISRKETGVISNHSANRSSIKSNSWQVNCKESKKNGLVSFTFNSPMTQRRRSGEGEHSEGACHSKKLMSDTKKGSLSSEKGMTLRGDELSNLLGEKIRELSSLDQSEDDVQGRSTVSILEELISALTTGAPAVHRNGESCSDASIQTEISVSNNQMINIDEEFQEKVQPNNTTAYSVVDISDQPSPMSILEASFSTDSCSLESLNENSEFKPQFGLQETCNKTQSSYEDCDLSDSATSLNINHPIEAGFSGSEVGPTTETISDAELLFENISLYDSDGAMEYSFDSFLLDTLENIISIFSQNSKDAKEGDHLREFLFDCIMECLDSKFSGFCRSGFRTWLKLPLILNRDRLMREVHVEIRGWGSLAGKTLDALVEMELSWSNSKWTLCQTETFEAGIEIQGYVLDTLIDEIVIDLC